MKVLAVVGTSRKSGLTAKLCGAVLEGAAEKGFRTEMINLYDYRIEFCRGCWGCARKGECVLRDDFALIFEKVKEADVIVLGSPCYWGNVSGIMKAFFDRHTGYAMYIPHGAHLYHSLSLREKLGILRNEMKNYGPKMQLGGKRFVFVVPMTAPLPMAYLSRDLPQTIGAMKTYMKNLNGRPAGKIVYTDTLFKFRGNKERRLLEKARGTGRNIGRIRGRAGKNLRGAFHASGRNNRGN
jgi:multimeric flavodoxin WrbA